MKRKKYIVSMMMAAWAGISSAADYTNIILVNLDDVGYGDFSCNGAYGYTTPHIDQLASQGVRFTHFLAGQPISGASRAGLLTGCYPNRIGFSGAPGPDSNYGVHQDEMTMGELLKQKGYATAIFGKWHLGSQYQFLPLQNGRGVGGNVHERGATDDFGSHIRNVSANFHPLPGRNAEFERVGFLSFDFPWRILYFVYFGQTASSHVAVYSVCRFPVTCVLSRRGTCRAKQGTTGQQITDAAFLFSFHHVFRNINK